MKQRSLHGKLFFLFAIATLVVMAIMGGVSEIFRRNQNIEPFKKNVAQYIEMLFEKMPPLNNHKAVEEFGRSLDIEIAAFAEDGQRLYGTDFPIEFYRRHTKTEYKNILFGDHRGHFFALARAPQVGRSVQPVLPSQAYWVVFAFDMHRVIDFPHRMLFGVTIFLVVLFLITFLVTRWLTKPISLLTEAVTEFGQGNWDYRIDHKVHQKEFQALADSFHAMASKIKKMLESKDRLLVDISHEMRSPLARMKLALEMLPTSEIKTSAQEDVLVMQQMIDQVLEGYQYLSQGGNQGKNHQLVKLDVSEFLSNLAKSYPGLKSQIESGLVMAADPMKLERAITNLLDNAFKYDSSGQVEIRAHYEKEKSVGSLSSPASSSVAKWLVIQVADQGAGVPDPEKQFIFEPFYRVDRSRSKTIPGYGLGLAIVASIAESYGGSVVCENNSPQGCRFILRLPV